ncbi:dTDP-4-dehydrorhamnose reductase [Prochlorococcus marinus str. MIT 1318]|uniref:dTDP-4-dehydrorhamnose reductase n=1 Tax=Prochlorococcus TaxID=1218 RepID=UPI0007B3D700|nr:dTDP-4-dehydrorhamnose reductase [Prochlorococcus marinus]KZR70711.1 dTDP-4-dehydrorhamnose reductase [Prochlorococcus marinus str. MIT 1318]
MKVLLTGAAGQLGQALVAAKPDGIELIATTRAQLDLGDLQACRHIVLNHRPDWVINAGAYTAVDKAESEPDLAYAINAYAPQAFAESLLETGGRLLQLSTDFVFNGRQGWPYRPSQARAPLGVYGASKAAGEEAVEERLGDVGRGLILRTSWLMGPVGRNFALSMLRLHQEREEIRVIADQVGCPTSTLTLAKACWRVIEIAGQGTLLPPLMHWCDAGVSSWYDVALAVGELGQQLALVDSPAQVLPITTADYPTPAMRPSYSLLDCTETRCLLDLEPQHWLIALAAVFKEVEQLRSAQPSSS